MIRPQFARPMLYQRNFLARESWDRITRSFEEAFKLGPCIYIQVLCGFEAIMGAHAHVAFNLHSFKEPAVGISSRFELTFLSPAVAYCSFSGNSMQHT